eukprot:CAMPEP_0179193756 /NCGR_PEP_ID=MMETSP0796-20121207/96291_1 /TAXON_ID=73915 /ORGANISM="Pyrodinium bahamense, Strain pbaha01" /LENGTH=534 /DNA_ID=CAMNT_0020898071 /DNA_START=20 /DNA_END=1623 /DNA_ORIENTATION=-
MTPVRGREFAGAGAASVMPFAAAFGAGAAGAGGVGPVQHPVVPLGEPGAVAPLAGVARYVGHGAAQQLQRPGAEPAAFKSAAPFFAAPQGRAQAEPIQHQFRAQASYEELYRHQLPPQELLPPEAVWPLLQHPNPAVQHLPAAQLPVGYLYHTSFTPPIPAQHHLAVQPAEPSAAASRPVAGSPTAPGSAASAATPGVTGGAPAPPVPGSAVLAAPPPTAAGAEAAPHWLQQQQQQQQQQQLLQPNAAPPSPPPLGGPLARSSWNSALALGNGAIAQEDCAAGAPEPERPQAAVPGEEVPRPAASAVGVAVPAAAQPPLGSWPTLLNGTGDSRPSRTEAVQVGSGGAAAAAATRPAVVGTSAAASAVAGSYWEATAADFKVGDTVSVEGRLGVVFWDGRPKHEYAMLRWRDDGSESGVKVSEIQVSPATQSFPFAPTEKAEGQAAAAFAVGLGPGTSGLPPPRGGSSGAGADARAGPTAGGGGNDSGFLGGVASARPRLLRGQASQAFEWKRTSTAEAAMWPLLAAELGWLGAL